MVFGMVLTNYSKIQGGKQIYFATHSLRKCSKTGVINVLPFWDFVLMRYLKYRPHPGGEGWISEPDYLTARSLIVGRKQGLPCTWMFYFHRCLSNCKPFCYGQPGRSCKTGKSIMTNQQLIYTWNRSKMDVSFYVVGI